MFYFTRDSVSVIILSQPIYFSFICVSVLNCIVLNEHNTVFTRSGPLCATGVSLGPPESSKQTTSQSLQLFLQGSLGDRPADRPTDHATRSVTIGGVHIGQAKFCYCLRLLGVSLGPPASLTQTAS